MKIVLVVVILSNIGLSIICHLQRLEIEDHKKAIVWLNEQCLPPLKPQNNTRNVEKFNDI